MIPATKDILRKQNDNVNVSLSGPPSDTVDVVQLLSEHTTDTYTISYDDDLWRGLEVAVLVKKGLSPLRQLQSPTNGWLCGECWIWKQ
jgi:hypothetical protein